MAKPPTFAERVRDEVNCEIQTLKKKLEEECAEREAERVEERAEREAKRAVERVKRMEERAADRVESDAQLEALKEEFMAIFANQSQVYILVKFMQMSCLLVISSVGSSMAWVATTSGEFLMSFQIWLFYTLF